MSLFWQDNGMLDISSETLACLTRPRFFDLEMALDG